MDKQAVSMLITPEVRERPESMKVVLNSAWGRLEKEAPHTEKSLRLAMIVCEDGDPYEDVKV
jgi:hypothetical protein